MHEPVLLKEVLFHLNLKPGQVILDGTVGSGGHSEAMLREISPTGFLVGLDQDEEAVQRAQKRLKAFGDRFVLQQLNFRHLDETLSSLNITAFDAVLLDVGLSREDLENPGRGFSFLREGPLDMRMDQRLKRTAADLITCSNEETLATILWQFGEERNARKIARAIVGARQKHQIRTTLELAPLHSKSVPPKARFGRIHPATRTFQALRIAVNDELGALEEALPKALKVLKPGGRLAAISFHSLEDRMIKRFFRNQEQAGLGLVVTKKPVRPSKAEVTQNPKARSAKLRVMERKLI